MHPVKRIEIIVNSVELGKILDGLKQAEISGYLLLRNVAGHGFRGGSEDLDMTMLDNVYVIAFCVPDKIKRTVEIIRPILNKFGGSCYISDATEIRSMRCIASL
ncbi:P-II family nitrogen regulator [Scytonema sp. UIC 10036]|uniref:P-II family nitrogen regulator n=1 Tax=Scytonema sp. UIC 10036 TaxID=2304196 RepID=UPI0012DA34C5|nr:P-II family nitrogen regulator [Scytonema sp. UIC 10036]MUH00424.1 P-II family nitrogen regulator [Scytonema sp. UIC 10036]